MAKQNQPGMGQGEFGKDKINQPSETGFGSQTGSETTEGQTEQSETSQTDQSGSTDPSIQPS